jgi:putative transposase
LAHAGLSPQSGFGRNRFLHGEPVDRRPNLLVRYIDALRAVVRRVRARAPFHIDASVVLPDHIHCLWTLPQGDADFPGRWRAIKIAFAKSLPAAEPRSAMMFRRGERGIWQRRYWEHTIRDDRDFAVHFDYIHLNLVKHGLVRDPADWSHSTFRRCVAPAGFTQPTGLAAMPNRRKPASGKESWSERARPTVSVVGGMRCRFSDLWCLRSAAQLSDQSRPACSRGHERR